MSNRMQTTVHALVLGLLVLGVFTLRYADSAGDVQELIRRSDENQQLEQVTRRLLEVRRQAMFRRREARQQAARAYIAQRCTLAESIQRWEELEQEEVKEWPPYLEILAQRQRLLSDEESHYEVILGYVEEILHRQPEKLAAVLRRLEKEYQQLRADRKMPSSLPRKRTEPSF